MIGYTLLVGTLGMFLLLLAFVANLLERLPRDSSLYTGMNFIGGGLLIFYAFELKSYPFLVLEAAWTLSAGYKLMKG